MSCCARPKQPSNGFSIDSKTKKFKERCECPQLSFGTRFPDNSYPPPEPPDGRYDLWDLQFCRWWGWNWVRKMEPNQKVCEKTILNPNDVNRCNRPANQKTNAAHCTPKIQTKKKCCGKGKKKENTVLQMNSRMTEPSPSPAPCDLTSFQPTKELRTLTKCLCYRKCSQQLSQVQKMYDTPTDSINFKKCCLDPQAEIPDIDDARNQPQSRRETEKEVSNKTKSWSKERSSSSTSSSSNELPTRVFAGKLPSSTDESIEYLAVRLKHFKSDLCCPCRKQKNIMKTDTATSNLKIGESCRSVQVNMQKTCVNSCTQTTSCKNESTKNPKHKHSHKKRKLYLVNCHCCCECCGKQKGKDDNHKNKQVLTETQNKGNSTVFYSLPTKHRINSFTNTKRLTKFGTPSKNYHWLQKSLSSCTVEEFCSPLTGQSYKLTPTIFKEEKTESIPELLDISENLENLKKLEATAKTDLEHRLMIGVVCDSILAKYDNDINDNCSNFLNEYTFHPTKTETQYRPMYRGTEFDVGNLLHKNNSKRTHEMIEDILQSSLHTAMQIPRSFMSNDINEINSNRTLQGPRPNEIQEANSCALNICRKQKRTSSGSLINSNTQETYKHAEVKPAENLDESTKKVNELLTNTDTNCTVFDRIVTINKDVEPTQSTSEFFKRIDEIVARSKMHNEEIQKILQTLPQNITEPCLQTLRGDKNIVETYTLQSSTSTNKEYINNSSNIQETDNFPTTSGLNNVSRSRVSLDAPSTEVTYNIDDNGTTGDNDKTSAPKKKKRKISSMIPVRK